MNKMKEQKCKYCHYQNTRERVLQHENDVHDQFNCLKCNKRIKANQGLASHEITVHEKVLCPICFKDFTETINSKLALKNHLLEKKRVYHKPSPRYRPLSKEDLALNVETYDLRDYIDGYYD